MKNRTIYSVVRLVKYDSLSTRYPATVLDSHNTYEEAENSKWRWEQEMVERNLDDSLLFVVQASVLYEV